MKIEPADGGPVFPAAPEGATAIERQPTFLERARTRLFPTSAEALAQRGRGEEPFAATLADAVRTGLQSLPGNLGKSAIPGAVAGMIPTTRTDIAALLATLPFGGEGSLLKGIAQRSLAAAGGAGAAEAVQGRNPLPAMGRAGGSQALGEALFSPLRLDANARALTRATAEFDRATAARQAKIDRDLAMHKAITSLEKTGHAQETEAAKEAHQTLLGRLEAARAKQVHAEKLAHAAQESQTMADWLRAARRAREAHHAAALVDSEAGARTIVEDVKTRVPAFADYPASNEGLLEVVRGRGQADLSKAFDATMKELVKDATGMSVEIPLRDAVALKLKPTGPVVEAVRGRPMAPVDGGLLAEAAVGFWKKDPGVYHRVVAALDERGLGNPEARAQYKAGQALIQFGRKSDMLKGHRYNPEIAYRALEKDSSEQLRRRGEGDIFRGAVAQTAHPAVPLELPPKPLKQPFIASPKPAKPVFTPPSAPPERPLPWAPPEPEQPGGFRVRTLPRIGFWEAGIPAEAAMSAFGHHGFGIPGAVAGLAGRALSGRQLVTQAPLSPQLEMLLRLYPALAAQIGRSVTAPER